MTVLITGGAGYIGSETVRYFLEQGVRVVVMDNLTTGSLESIPQEILYQGDILDERLLESVFTQQQIDSVIHFAACKNVGESMKNPRKYWKNNVLGTMTLLNQMERFGVKKIVFSSSCSVYGNPGSLPVTETSPLAPQSVYAESKLICERLLNWHSVANGLQAISLRYFNAAGASLDGRYGEDWSLSENLIPRVLRALLQHGAPLEIFGSDYDTNDGTAIRDYVHVRDLADAHFKAYTRLDIQKGSVAINLGTGVGSSVLDIINSAALISNATVPFVFGPRRAGDPEKVFADYSLARELLEWEPTINLREIVSTALVWHRSQVGKTS
jgi:UDP-glucose-4-epimerase GalE